MSVVTTVVILGDLDDDVLEAIESFAWQGGRTAHFGVKIPYDSKYVGGGKCLESDVRIAAFNHFPWQEFLKHLEGINFGYDTEKVVVSWSSYDLDGSGSWQPRLTAAPLHDTKEKE